MKKLVILFSLILTYNSFSQGTRLLRQPTLSDNQVVFVHAADLWKAPLTGGNAVRLTSDEGYESSPRFSKDGKWIAFTAQYDGNTDVFVIFFLIKFIYYIVDHSCSALVFCHL